MSFVFLVPFHRKLFPTKPELLEELFERTGVDSTRRAHEVGFEDYGKICQTFIEMSREHDMPVTPLRVRKPVAIATVKDTGKDANANELQINRTQTTEA